MAALIAAPLLLYSPPAFAWGGLGHEAVCELAFLELDDTARQRVNALIRLDEEFNLFRASCNWPDRPRQRAAEHFVNLPRNATGLSDDLCPLAEKCVVTAIEEDVAVLASPDATDAERAVRRSRSPTPCEAGRRRGRLRLPGPAAHLPRSGQFVEAFP
jgi:hypothetical protein